MVASHGSVRPVSSVFCVPWGQRVVVGRSFKSPLLQHDSELISRHGLVAPCMPDSWMCGIDYPFLLKAGLMLKAQVQPQD